MIGRIGTGYLLDRTFAARLASILFAVSASGIALLLLGNRPVAFAGPFLVGLGLGAEVDLIPYLASRYLGFVTSARCIALYSLLLHSQVRSVLSSWVQVLTEHGLTADHWLDFLSRRFSERFLWVGWGRIVFVRRNRRMCANETGNCAKNSDPKGGINVCRHQ